MNTVQTMFKSTLIIDDDDDLCLLLKSLLETVIENVYCSNNLVSGLKALERIKPDILFVDNNLPEGASAHFIRQMKTISPNTLIYLISAIDNFTENAAEFGADGFIAKPLTRETILAVLDNSKIIRSN